MSEWNESGREPRSPLFAEPKRDRGLPVTAIAIAGTAVALIVAVLLLVSHRKPANPHGELPLDPYAANLHFSQVQMSEAGSLAGGREIYIEGSVTNAGPKTVTGATVQLFFRNDVQLPPQIETVPLQIVRMREPEIDMTSLAASPLAPGQTASFRLTFEDVGENWNQSVPEIHLVHTDLR